MNRVTSILGAVFAAVFASGAAANEGTGAAQANNPLASFNTVNIQNYYYGKLKGTSGTANAFLLRGAVPIKAFGGEWILRATLPVNRVPNFAVGGNETGLGDLNVFAAYLIDTGDPRVTFGIGPQLTAPTASNSLLGSEKWSAGLANVLFKEVSPKFQFGYLLTWQASFAGSDNSPNVNEAAFQPFLFRQLGQGWYLRSTGIMSYNLENNDYNIPIGFGIGKVTKAKKAIINTFVEPQVSVASRGVGQPEWQIYMGVNFQFPKN